MHWILWNAGLLMEYELGPYVIAYDYEGRWQTYMYRNEIHYGSLVNAMSFLEYVKGQSPDKDWRIIWITFND